MKYIYQISKARETWVAFAPYLSHPLPIRSISGMGACQKIVVWAAARIKNLLYQISIASIAILICGLVISSQVSAQGTDSQQNVLPVVNISTTTPTVSEGTGRGNPARIIFSLDRAAPSNDFQVSFSIDDSTNQLESYSAGLHIVNFRVGETSKEITLIVKNDREQEPRSSFSVSLDQSPSYVLGVNSTVSVNVTASDSPPVISVAQAKAVHGREGAIAEFTLHSFGYFAGTKVINVSVTGVTRNVAGNEIPNSVEMIGNFEGIEGQSKIVNGVRTILSVPIHEDQINEGTGQITLTIKNPTTLNEYKIGTVNSKRINISQFSVPTTTLPTISISTVSKLARGDADYFFRITTSHVSDVPIRVNLEVRHYTDFTSSAGSGGRAVYVIPAGRKFREFTSPTFRSYSVLSTENIDAKVEAEIMSGSGYLVAASPDNFVRISHRRFDEPTGISIIAPDKIFESSESVKFQITASEATQFDREIYVDVNARNSSLLFQPGLIKTVLPAGKTRIGLKVMFTKNWRENSNSFITARIVANSGYSVASTRNSATVEIIDDDSRLPTLYLSKFRAFGYSPWIEGELGRLVIKSTRLINSNYPVRLRVSDSGGNLYDGDEILTFTRLSSPADLIEINTIDDAIVEEDGTITVEILPGAGYIVSPEYQRATFTVYDDDGVGEISVRALESTITEGQYAQFQVTPSVFKKGNYTISFNYNDGDGDFIGELATTSRIYSGGSAGSGYINLYHQYTRIIRISTIDDEIVESNGYITLNVGPPLNGNAYSLSSDATKNSARVTVLDNDSPVVDTTPVISISSAATSVVESNSAQFRLTTSATSSSPISVNVNVSQTGNVLAGASGELTVIIPASATEHVLYIATEDDVVDESDGSITVTLLADDNATATYTISTNVNNQSAEVEVTDDDALPVYSITSVADSVVESNSAQFRLTSPTASSSQVTIRINVVSDW